METIISNIRQGYKNQHQPHKVTLLAMGIVFFTLSLSAQYQNATNEQKKGIIGQITQAAGDMHAMQCDFTQVKESSFLDEKITLEGKVYYKKPNKIRFEYTKPNAYVIAMDGQNMSMTSGGQKTTIPANQSKLFSEISRVMVSGVSGSGLVDSPDFDTQLSIGNTDYKVVLTPKKKEVRDLFSAIQLFVGKSDHRIRSVELIEKGGDKTTINLRNLSVNTAINDEIFR